MKSTTPAPAHSHSTDLVYDQPINVHASNDSHALMLRMIGSDVKVLEYGCSTGRMSAILQERGCTVTGIEIDPEAAALARAHTLAVYVIDLDRESVTAALAGARFDVIVFGDVLEHLRNPAAVLAEALEFLAPQGRVVISVPNMAHADVRLALLQGQVPYADWGLLDRTHLRWFTRDSLEQLLSDAGLDIFEWQRTSYRITETEVPYDREAVPASLMEWLRQQPETTTYQFVVQARRREQTAPAQKTKASTGSTRRPPARWSRWRWLWGRLKG